MNAIEEFESRQSRTYRIVNEVFNSITHGIGTGLSIAGLVILIVVAVRTGGAMKIVAFSVYGATLILLYLFSTLYHSLTFTRAKKVFKIFDHSCVYILIAGTYTPYSLVTVSGATGWVLFGIIWALAIMGVVSKSIWMDKYEKFSTVIYVAMGWLCIFFIKPIYTGLGKDGFTLLLLGGLAFTVGAVFYSLRVKFMHVVWHFFVLLGTILMYFSILFYA